MILRKPTGGAAFEHAREQLSGHWDALQAQAGEAVSDVARKSVSIQLARLCRESLLKELGNRSVLPSHGFPSDVVPFLNLCAETRMHMPRTTEDDDTSAPIRRYDFATRKADVALRDYAPGADALARRLLPGDVMTIFSPDSFDLAALSAEPFASLLNAARARGAAARLALRRMTFEASNAAQRLGLRDVGARHDLVLVLADPSEAPNGAVLLVTLETAAGTTAWYTRDRTAAAIGTSWGVGPDAPIVYGVLPDPCVVAAIDAASLLPRPTTAMLVISDDAGRPLDEFGPWLARQLRDKLEPLSLWRPGTLASLSYSDRYLRSPLTVALAWRACAGLRDALAPRGARIPLRIVSAPVSPSQSRLPFHLHDDWQRTEDRDRVAAQLAQFLGFTTTIGEGAPHWRELCLTYRGVRRWHNPRPAASVRAGAGRRVGLWE